jgi:hypothetical protein
MAAYEERSEGLLAALGEEFVMCAAARYFIGQKLTAANLRLVTNASEVCHFIVSSQKADLTDVTDAATRLTENWGARRLSSPLASHAAVLNPPDPGGYNMLTIGRPIPDNPPSDQLID